LILSASAPEDQFAAYQTEIIEPFILSLEVGAAPTLTPDSLDAVPTTFELYTSEELRMTFDIPAGWVAYIDQSLSSPERGSAVVLFFADPADVGGLSNHEAKHPAIAFIRMATDDLIRESFDEPEDVLSLVADGVVERLTISGYSSARLFFENEVPQGVLYVLELEDCWLMTILVLPETSNARLWDEVVMLPIVRSIQVTGSGPVPAPTLTPFPTYTPLPTYTPNPTYTPVS
jgi:hypothetical protein